MHTIRPVVAADMPAIKAVIDANQLFPSAMMDDMMAAYLHGDADEIWLTNDAAHAQSVAYCAPERMTSGTWNMLLIAVHPQHQGKGIGAALTLQMEDRLRARGERVLLVETSGFDQYAPTRRFYQKQGFAEEARIRDYYQQGEDKIIYRKPLR